MYVGLSISARILLNAEALNMAESVGNVVRHRKAPVVLKKDNEVQVVYVPAISGESLAHAYQVYLAQTAKEMGLPVCSCCERGVFIKSSDDNAAKKCGHAISKKMGALEVERKIISSCVVEDVGGFLYTPAPAKRTSRFRVGYMLPTLDTLQSGAFGNEPEFHVRFSGADQEGQIPYYVEIGSALYNFTYSIDLSEIGRLSSDNAELGKDPGALPAEERLKRADAALAALKRFLGTMLFGAKRTRFNPQWEVFSLQAAVVTIPFEVTPGNDLNFVRETVERLKALDKEAYVYYFSKEDLAEPEGNERVRVERASNYLEAVAKASEKAMELLRASLK
ncbi:MAG: type I-A CRISPR-associated protein Cas7/Csa2 [Crenarchaeota archaeon]|nr:type I-A CRISPR-associated protein Cas7/Csa2 [Thermoproteota archaeon]